MTLLRSTSFEGQAGLYDFIPAPAFGGQTGFPKRDKRRLGAVTFLGGDDIPSRG